MATGCMYYKRDDGILVPISGVSDHGQLAGLADDDHPQYALYSWRTLHVAGQTDLVAGERADTLNLAAGTGIDLDTTPGTDTLTVGLANPPQFFAGNVSAVTTSAATETASCLTMNAGPFPVAGIFVYQGAINGAGSVANDIFNQNIKNSGVVVRLTRQPIIGTTNQMTNFAWHLVIVVAAAGSVAITTHFQRLSGTGTFSAQSGSASGMWYPT